MNEQVTVNDLMLLIGRAEVEKYNLQAINSQLRQRLTKAEADLKESIKAVDASQNGSETEESKASLPVAAQET